MIVEQLSDLNTDFKEQLIKYQSFEINCPMSYYNPIRGD